MRTFKVLRQSISPRGGGIEIDLTPEGYEGGKMTAYQNYLGGGMLGAVQSDCNIQHWYFDDELTAIADELRRYYHELTNEFCDEWSESTYEENQLRPNSAIS